MSIFIPPAQDDTQSLTVAVGLSGGVDSAVSAYLLKEAGYKVIGLFMKNWEEDDASGICPAEADAKDAEKVAKKLGIEFYRTNFAYEYYEDVFEHFLKEYEAGRTPNPDILCNQFIKFRVFLDYAKNLGADRIATGHYAKRVDIGDEVALCRAHDIQKDQTYFLHRLDQSQLAPSLFPLADFEKSAVRQLANDLDLPVYAKKDSTGICFIGEKRFREFLGTYVPAQPGDIVDENGQCIGTHQGLMFYTYGQRKGLGIGGAKDRAELAWYVIDKDLKNNRLIVGQGGNHPKLLHKTLITEPVHWIRKTPELPKVLQAKVRHSPNSLSCKVSALIDNDTTKAPKLRVDFDAPVRAITPGQSVVFYDGEETLGGAIIESHE